MKESSQLMDICVICALPEEVKAFLETVCQCCSSPIEDGFSQRYHYDYRFTQIQNNRNETLYVHVSWLPRYGSQEMTLHLSHVLEEYHPRLVMMTGICAGDPQKVQLGDLVIAERTFTYDNGKFIRDEDGRLIHEYDTLTYSLQRSTLQFLGLFHDSKTLTKRLEQAALHYEERKAKCYIAPMASGSAIRADHPFEEIQRPVRGTAAIDMEGAAFGMVMSDHSLIPWLIVKGVSDYADQSKDDSYHAYAAHVSALYALSFIQAYVTDERLPRHNGSSPSSRAGPFSPVYNKGKRPLYRRVSSPVFLLSLVGILVIPLGIFLRTLPPQVPSISLKDANINGWLFVREQNPGSPNILETFNPRTGQLHLLWPNKQELQKPTISAHFTDYYGPNYSPSAHLLAFLADDGSGHRSVWLAHVVLGVDGWPAFSNVPVQLINQCDSCGELAWSPGGKWLIFAGVDGLYAISILTHQQQRITFYPHDAWPACSPDGKWLAYQGPHHTIQAVSSVDCLPISSAIAQVRFVNGVSYTWHPMWSLDGKEIIFSSNVTNGWILYRVAFSDMQPFYDPNQRTSYTQAGAFNCGALAWARRQQTGQEIIIFTCKDAQPRPDTYGCSLLIQPATLPPSWEVMISARAALWDDVDWAP